jgi:hypothetical protein
MIRVSHGCNEHANLNEMSGLQGGVMIKAILYKKDNMNGLCSPTSALEKNAEPAGRGTELRNSQ